MRQSVYTKISKSLGWENIRAVPIPTIEEANQLFANIEHNHCQTSFRLVFERYRFCPTPEDNDEVAAMEIIIGAFHLGNKIFSKKYDDDEED